MTRRLVAETKTEQVLVRLTPSERAQVEALAVRLGCRPPDVFRIALTSLQLAQSFAEQQEFAHAL